MGHSPKTNRDRQTYSFDAGGRVATRQPGRKGFLAVEMTAVCTLDLRCVLLQEPNRNYRWNSKGLMDWIRPLEAGYYARNDG